MKILVKSALAAIAFTALATGAAFAADCACYKDKACDMACCDKAEAGPKAAPTTPQHQH